MRILTILARFGSAHYSGAEEELDRMLARQLPGADRSMIIVDNAMPAGTVQQEHGRMIVGGDNTAFEFSAFDRAIDLVGSDIWSYDFLHFATSAFRTLYVAYQDRVDVSLLRALRGKSACLGHIDCYNEHVDVLRFRSQHWIRSCFFFMPPTEVKLLGSFVSISDSNRFFTDRPESPFRSDAPLSESYRRYITEWLTGGDLGQGVTWHSCFTLSDDTMPSFKRKALCIMNEHLLAIRLRALGCRLVDATWLATQLSRRRSIDTAWRTEWHAQLAGRDTDALRVALQQLPS